MRPSHVLYPKLLGKMTYQVRKFSKVSISTVHPRKYRKDFLLQEEGMESLNLSLRPFPLLVSRRPIFLQRDRLWCPASGSMLTKLSTRKEAWRMEKSLSVLRQFDFAEGLRSDSPTADTDIHLLICAWACCHGALHSADVASAYFQGMPLDQVLLMSQPRG